MTKKKLLKRIEQLEKENSWLIFRVESYLKDSKRIKAIYDYLGVKEVYVPSISSTDSYRLFNSQPKVKSSYENLSPGAGN